MTSCAGGGCAVIRRRPGHAHRFSHRHLSRLSSSVMSASNEKGAPKGNSSGLQWFSNPVPAPRVPDFSEGTYRLVCTSTMYTDRLGARLFLRSQLDFASLRSGFRVRTTTCRAAALLRKQSIARLPDRPAVSAAATAAAAKAPASEVLCMPPACLACALEMMRSKLRLLRCREGCSDEEQR